MAEKLVKAEVIAGVVTGSDAEENGNQIDAAVGETVWVRKQSLESMPDRLKSADAPMELSSPPKAKEPEDKKK